MSCRGVTLQTRAASAADRRSRWITSPSFAMRTWDRMSCASPSATLLPFSRRPRCAVAGGDECAWSLRACQEVGQVADTGPRLAGRGLACRLLLALRRGERLAVGDLHVDVVVRDPARREVGPLPRDLDR